MKKVLAGGRFNAIHPGHIYFLQKARSLGDRLVVVIANDQTVRKKKKRLLFPAAERKKMVEALQFVDRAVIGYPLEDEEGYARIVAKERPSVIALGYDQKVDLRKLRKALASRGLVCAIARIRNYKGYRTRKIMAGRAKEKKGKREK